VSLAALRLEEDEDLAAEWIAGAAADPGEGPGEPGAGG
jgi:hypothetical protein